jgi:DNA-binding NtrC family response regulator
VRNISRDALDALLAHDWPGNIRELLNVVERACGFAEGDCVQVRDLPPQLQGAAAPAAPAGQASMSTPPRALLDGETPAPLAPSSLPNTFKEAKEQWNSAFERDFVLGILRRNGFNISRAAREAEIDRKYFRKLMRKYGLDGHDPSDGTELDESADLPDEP